MSTDEQNGRRRREIERSILGKTSRVAELEARLERNRQLRQERRLAYYDRQYVAVYGWNELLAAAAPQGWLMQAQEPFRPLALWVWSPHESAVLESLRVDDHEYLTQPQPLRQFIAPCDLDTFWRELFPDRKAPLAYGPEKLPPRLAALTQVTIEGLPTLTASNQLFLRLRGFVRALAMVGPALKAGPSALPSASPLPAVSPGRQD